MCTWLFRQSTLENRHSDVASHHDGKDLDRGPPGAVLAHGSNLDRDGQGEILNVSGYLLRLGEELIAKRGRRDKGATREGYGEDGQEL